MLNLVRFRLQLLLIKSHFNEEFNFLILGILSLLRTAPLKESKKELQFVTAPLNLGSVSFGNQGLAAGITVVGRGLDSGMVKEGIVGSVITLAILCLRSISFAMISSDYSISCMISST